MDSPFDQRTILPGPVKTTWPMGLRVVLGVLVIIFAVNAGQLVYYSLMRGSFVHDELGGKWALVSFVMGYVTIMLGGFRLRRLFTLGATALCLYSIPLTAYLTWPMFLDFWQVIFAGRTPLARMLNWDTWCLAWNNICLSVDTGVLFYLLFYEFRLFTPASIGRRMP